MKKCFSKQQLHIVKVIVLLLSLCCLVFSLGCAQKNEQSAPKESSYTITDDTGVKLNFKRKPQRIISMSISTDEILLEMVDPKRIVALSGLVDSPAISNVSEQAKQVQGRFKGSNLESLLALKPDLIVAPDFISVEMLQNFRDMGINIYLYKTPSDIIGIQKTIANFGKLVGEEENAQRLIDGMNKKLAYVKKRVSTIPYEKQRRVMLCGTHSTMYIPDSSFSNVCKYAGVRDAVQELKYDYQCILSQEEIVRLNPDTFVLAEWNYDGEHDVNVLAQELVTNPSYKSTNAGKNKSIVTIPAARLLSLSQYTADAVVDLAKAIYPEKFSEVKPMKIAFCHLNTSMGPEEKNLTKLEQAIKLAAERGAKWVITPETSVQGYYFYRNDKSKKDSVDIQPSEKLANIRKLVKEYNLYLFLGAGEFDAKEKKNFNSCLVFGPSGEIIGNHRKIFNHGIGSEAWASPGKDEVPIKCGDITVGALVCADAWFYEHMEAMKQKGAQLTLVIAAWPPTKETGDPLPKWKENALKSGMPFLLCNQTGSNPYMDMTVGQSVVIEDGEVKLTHQGDEAVLLFEMDIENGQVLSKEYEIVKM
ncbi:MAG: nitrilase-related carbon-nitrogen hydrolase [Phascolarctobacterium sp.]|nr:nitrilase-related carbon-nitrogen hydrolase [Phascolarctobacterium sp.]